MAGNSEEDFWNTSSFSSFNFDDEEDISQKTSGSTDVIFSSNIQKSTSLPIHSVISKRGLGLILGEIDLKLSKKAVPPVEETIRNMFYGRRYVLEVYRTLEHKIQLLDQSIATYDGNVILMVILFLSRTLSRSVFFYHLLKREVAVNHYISYLIFHNRFKDLGDLNMAKGASSNLRLHFFLTVGKTLNKEYMLRKLEEQIVYCSPWKEIWEEFNEHKNFIKWQVDRKETAESPVEQLALLCRNQYQKKDVYELANFRQIIKISDFQFEWVQLNVLASLQLWKILSNLFISENWLAKKKTLKSCIRPELFLLQLYKHKPPTEVLQDFITKSNLDTETSLYYTKKMQCHKFVIDYYIAQKDRQALISYKSNVPAQSEEFFYIENALHSSDKLWKN